MFHRQKGLNSNLIAHIKSWARANKVAHWLGMLATKPDTQGHTQ